MPWEKGGKKAALKNNGRIMLFLCFQDLPVFHINTLWKGRKKENLVPRHDENNIYHELNYLFYCDIIIILHESEIPAIFAGWLVTTWFAKYSTANIAKYYSTIPTVSVLPMYLEHRQFLTRAVSRNCAAKIIAVDLITLRELGKFVTAPFITDKLQRWRSSEFQAGRDNV